MIELNQWVAASRIGRQFSNDPLLLAALIIMLVSVERRAI